MKTKKLIISLILLTIVELSALYLSRLNINNFTQKNSEVIFGEYTSKKKELLNNISQSINNQITSSYELQENINKTQANITILTENFQNLETENHSLTTQKETLQKQYLLKLSTPKKSENKHIINGIITQNQYPNYPNGCESVALYVLLKYYNINVTIEDIVNTLDKGEAPHFENGIQYGGHPELEFVGDPRLSTSFGVYEKPIQNIANKYKPNIINATGIPLNTILEKVSQNKPVLVWNSMGMGLPYVSTSWIYKPTKEKINWLAPLHAVVIIGYTDSEVIVSDSLYGNIYYRNKNTFEKIYNAYGKRALYYEE